MKNKIKINYAYLGNGYHVWDINHPDRTTLAHITPYREVQFRQKDLPEQVKESIRQIARTDNGSISQTQDAKVFRVPPIEGDVFAHIKITRKPCGEYDGIWSEGKKMAYDITEMLEAVLLFHCLRVPDDFREPDSPAMICEPYSRVFDTITWVADTWNKAIKNNPRLAASKSEDFAAECLEVMEKMLSSFSITVPDAERYDGEENAISLYGATYTSMMAEIAHYITGRWQALCPSGKQHDAGAGESATSQGGTQCRTM